jgi:ABC-2 type transport system ATP-binding protein
MADKKYAVEVRDVHKKFSYSRHKNNSLKRAITQMFKEKDTGKDSFYALDGISFNVEKGDFFGILGRNGSGKSTLLKIISEIYQPTSGSVKHDGKLVSFIELGVGFKPELTGKENVYLNGGLLGFSKKEVEEMYDDIVSFAELEDFMDQQLKNYSSGMKVRLAFSVAIRAKADILILDEVLAVGDAAFQEKCTNYFETLKEDGKTVILVTHSMSNVRKFCNKAIVIEDGKIQFEGDADKAADTYLDLFTTLKNPEFNLNQARNKKLSNVDIENIAVQQNNKNTETIQFKEDFSVSLKIVSDKVYEDVVMGVYIKDQVGRNMVVISSNMFGRFNLKKGVNTIAFTIQNIFADGLYYIDLAIEERESKKLLVQQHKMSPFTITGQSESNRSRRSLTHPDIEVHFG